MNITVEKVTKTYRLEGSSTAAIDVLSQVSVTLPSGKSAALLGPSGSGKSTLLSLIAGLDSPDQGRVLWGETDLGSLGEEARARLRARTLGLVFQSYHLIPTLTALENILLPLELLGRTADKKLALGWLERLGLASRAAHFPRQLSGGEQQRVAIARALIHDPPILLADEPTGNLDSKNGRAVADLLFAESGRRTVLLVTHDESIATRADQVIRIQDGQIAV